MNLPSLMGTLLPSTLAVTVRMSLVTVTSIEPGATWTFCRPESVKIAFHWEREPEYSMLFNAVQLENAASGILVTLLGIAIRSSCSQPAKASSRICVIPSGISMLFKLIQPAKTDSGSSVILHENSMSCRAEQFIKAPVPIEITESGILTDARYKQQSKAWVPILATALGVLKARSSLREG